MRLLLLGVLLAVLLTTMPLMLMRPDWRPTIEVLISLYLISNYGFILCRGAYRVIRNMVHRAYQRLDFTWFDSILISSAANLAIMYLRIKLRHKDQQEYPTIIALFIEQQIKHNARAQFILMCTLTIYIGIAYILNNEIVMPAVLIILLLLFALNFNERMLICRVTRGLYGTNEYEAREFLAFITSHTDAALSCPMS